jgi:hypothetical protein
MPRPPGEKPPKRDAKAERRAEALRANLKRRKAASAAAGQPKKPEPAGD